MDLLGCRESRVPETPFLEPLTQAVGVPSPNIGLAFLGGSPAPCQVSAQTAKRPCLQKPPLHLNLPPDTCMRSGT